LLEQSSMSARIVKYTMTVQPNSKAHVSQQGKNHQEQDVHGDNNPGDQSYNENLEVRAVGHDVRFDGDAVGRVPFKRLSPDDQSLGQRFIAMGLGVFSPRRQRFAFEGSKRPLTTASYFGTLLDVHHLIARLAVPTHLDDTEGE